MACNLTQMSDQLCSFELVRIDSHSHRKRYDYLSCVTKHTRMESIRRLFTATFIICLFRKVNLELKSFSHSIPILRERDSLKRLLQKVCDNAIRYFTERNIELCRHGGAEG